MRGKRRAIVLISTMLLLIIITMVVTAGLALIPGGLGLSVNYHDKRMALLAADAGQQYALTRLQQDTKWRGNGIPDRGANGGAVTEVDAPGMVVVEDRGNVVGYLRGPYNDVGQFRIRFNFQDGSGGGTDNLSNPSTYTVRHQYVSINNLAGAGARDVPRANQGGSWAVSATPPVPYEVAPFTACIIVEGRAGPGFRDISAADPNYDPPSGRIATFISETQFVPDLADATIYSRDNVVARTSPGEKFELKSDIPDKVPRIRSLGDVLVEAVGSGLTNYLPDSGTTVHVDSLSSKVFRVNGNVETSDPNVGELPQMSWGDIRKADGSKATMRAGLYVWRMSPTERFLEYYPADFDPTVDAVPAQGASFAGHLPTRIDTPAQLDTSGREAIRPDGEPFEIQFTEDTLVQPSGTAMGLAVVPDPAVTASKNRPTVVLDVLDTTGSEAAPVMTASGNVVLVGELTGEGAVTSEGSITFQGPSALEAQPWHGVAVYAKGDINLTAIPDEVVEGIEEEASSGGGGWGKGKGKGKGKGWGHWDDDDDGGGSPTPTPTPTPPAGTSAQDVTLKGVVYTQRSFNIDLRTGVTDPGFFDFTGVLVAFGGDPATGTPTPGTGGVNMNVRGARITYSDKWLNHFQLPNTPMVRKMWANH